MAAEIKGIVLDVDYETDADNSEIVVQLKKGREKIIKFVEKRV